VSDKALASYCCVQEANWVWISGVWLASFNTDITMLVLAVLLALYGFKVFEPPQPLYS
jgi:hypothetical protein